MIKDVCRKLVAYIKSKLNVLNKNDGNFFLFIKNCLIVFKFSIFVFLKL